MRWHITLLRFIVIMSCHHVLIRRPTWRVCIVGIYIVRVIRAEIQMWTKIDRFEFSSKTL